MSQKDAEKSDDNQRRSLIEKMRDFSIVFDSNNKTDDQRRPLIKKLHNFILNLIAFSANEKTEAVVKFTSLCSIPLIIGNYIPI